MIPHRRGGLGAPLMISSFMTVFVAVFFCYVELKCALRYSAVMTRFLFVFLFLFPGTAFAQAEGVGDVTILGMLAFITLAIGVPAAISYVIRMLTKDNLASYVGTFVIVAIGYAIARTMFGFIIDGGIITVGLILAVPSMLGAVVAQTVYYLRLPTRKL